MEETLSGKRALVCGASSGIGAATAHALASMGARVLGVARRADRLASVVAALPGTGHESLVADLDDRDAFLAQVTEASASDGLSICINNTGGPPAGPILSASPALFAETFARHVLVAQALAQLLVPGMRAQGFGRIVNVISTSVYEPIPNLGVSNTVRGAMASWSKSLASELPAGVTINNVLPGFTETERLEALADARATKAGTTREQVYDSYVSQIPEGRLGRAEEIAAAIAFLCSPAASYVRGVSLAVDGGRLRSI